MTSKIPPDAFDFYVSQGERRSYQATAEHFGVSKCAVAKRAKREDWAGRLASIEASARAISDRKLSESIADMQDRHLRMAKAMGARALAGLRDYPIEDGMDAVRAAELVIKLERLLARSLTDRELQSVGELRIVRRTEAGITAPELRVDDGAGYRKIRSGVSAEQPGSESIHVDGEDA